MEQVGFGFTVIVAVIGAPAHPLAVGIKVKVTVIGEAVVFVNVPVIILLPGRILPLPLAGIPVTFTVSSLVQVKVVPLTLPDNVISPILVPEHTVCDDGVATRFGVGFTTIE